MVKKQSVYINGLFLGQEMTGVQKFAFAICQEMARLDIEIIFLCPKSIKTKPSFGHIQKFGKLNRHLWEQITLPLYLKRNKIKTLVNLCNTAPLLSSENILCIHDLSFYNYGKWFSKMYSCFYRFLTPKIVKKAKNIITVSEFSKKQIVETYSIKPEKIKVIYNGIYFNDSSTDRNFSAPNRKYILFVGSLNPRKNLSMLIEAVEGIGQNDLDLIIVGKKSKIFKNEESSKSTQIKFYDQTNDSELQKLYKNAEMLVMPSYYEGFGLPVLEALSFGCPVICSDIPVFQELFKNFVIFFNLESKEELKQKIVSILNKEQLININKKELIKKYNYSNGAKLMLEIINS